MKEIKRIDVMSFAKLYAVIYASIGFLIGLMVASLGSAISELSGSNSFGGFGMLSVIIFPLLLGFVGFIAGLIGSAIYNLFAGWVGGIKIELKDVAAS